MYNEIVKELKNLAEPKFAEWFKPFINYQQDSKEIVLGVRVPILRKLAKKYMQISDKELLKLLQNNCHEYRALAIFIMCAKVKTEPKKICQLYLDNLQYINNWDLIDYSAPHIVAPNVDKKTLIELSNSGFMWANRIAMVSTIYYIKQNDFEITLDFAKKFISHPHHLIHKATGWMLREIGKRNETVLIEFLDKYSKDMPSVMRSYATEKLRKNKRLS